MSIFVFPYFIQLMKNYPVQKIPNKSLIINGKTDADLWNQAEDLSNFQSPWDAEEIAEIQFKALYDDVNLYFSFKVFDSNVHIVSKDNSTDSINNSDRVELFFRADSAMTPYYCLEIDPTPRIMDFKALPHKVFDFDWNWPAGDIEAKSTREASYFVVEGAISLQSLKELNLLKNGKIETGIFRAKYNKTENNSFEPTWITWVNPNTEEPNFHIATSFGLLELK